MSCEHEREEHRGSEAVNDRLGICRVWLLSYLKRSQVNNGGGEKSAVYCWRFSRGIFAIFKEPRAAVDLVYEFEYVYGFGIICVKRNLCASSCFR